MPRFAIISVQELKALFAERVFFLLLGVFVGMTLLSSFLGYIATRTTTSIYEAAVRLLTEKGVGAIAPNPLQSLPALTNFRNIIIYIFLVGALLAVVIGHRSFVRERKSGVLPLLFSRPLSPGTLLAGKVGGIAAALFVILGITFLVSVASSFLLPFKHLDAADILHLFLFYALSFCYLIFFALVGLLFAVRAKSESTALFLPVVLWVGVSFVLPELITGQTPTALLNPVTMDQMAPAGSFFSMMQSWLGPISIGSHYAAFSSQLLDNSLASSTTGAADIVTANAGHLGILAIMITATMGLCYFALRHYDIKRMAINE
ncbi:MAG: ABC transporter permease [Thermoleophilia bacterium]